MHISRYLPPVQNTTLPFDYLSNRFRMLLNAYIYTRHRITCTVRQRMTDDQDQTEANEQMLSFFEECIIIFHTPAQFPKNRDASNIPLNHGKFSLQLI